MDQSWPAVANGLVYVGDAYGFVDAFNATTGKLARQYPTPSGVEATPVVANGIVYDSAEAAPCTPSAPPPARSWPASPSAPPRSQPRQLPAGPSTSAITTSTCTPSRYRPAPRSRNTVHCTRGAPAARGAARNLDARRHTRDSGRLPQLSRYPECLKWVANGLRATARPRSLAIMPCEIGARGVRDRQTGLTLHDRARSLRWRAVPPSAASAERAADGPGPSWVTRAGAAAAPGPGCTGKPLPETSTRRTGRSERSGSNDRPKTDPLVIGKEARRSRDRITLSDWRWLPPSAQVTAVRRGCSSLFDGHLGHAGWADLRSGRLIRAGVGQDAPPRSSNWAAPRFPDG